MLRVDGSILGASSGDNKLRFRKSWVFSSGPVLQGNDLRTMLLYCTSFHSSSPLTQETLDYASPDARTPP
jgi:hypothetical protein